MSSAPVLVERLGGVGLIRFNRPEALNALDLAAKTALLAALADLSADPGVRCVVLTGTGRAFCVGQDLREHVTQLALSYVKERTAFGKPIGKFQNTRFAIAEMATEAHVARVFVDDCVRRHLVKELDASGASMAKWWSTELQNKLVNQGVQLHGGYGYMMEFPIARAYLDSRISTIYGGTTEIQKEIIGRSLGL